MLISYRLYYIHQYTRRDLNYYRRNHLCTVIHDSRLVKQKQNNIIIMSHLSTSFFNVKESMPPSGEFGFTSFIIKFDKEKRKKKNSLDRDRTRTCNLRIRSPTPYPLGHTVRWNILPQPRISRPSRNAITIQNDYKSTWRFIIYIRILNIFIARNYYE